MIIPPPNYNVEGFPPLEDSSWIEIERRMRRKTVIDPKTGCWLFQGSKIPDGYGNIRVGESAQLVHRIAAAIYLGYNLEDKEHQINHKDDICPYRNCWWYEHLYIGTQQDNISDILTRGIHVSTMQSEKTHCPAGHPYDYENTRVYKGRRYCRTCDRERRKTHGI